MAYLKSYQNLVLLQNLYRLQSTGFEYIDHFNINEKTSYEKPITLQELSANISNCHLCDLSKSRTQSMSGFGDENAKLMVIDFSVSQTQDSSNSYYSGRAGETLKKMIENVLKIDINNVFLTHSVKCKTLNANKPSPSECNSCKSYLLAQIEFIKPKIILCLGEDTYSNLTGNSDNFENVRGHIVDYKDAKLMPIYHPNYLLRNPNFKQITLSDLQIIKRYL